MGCLTPIVRHGCSGCQGYWLSGLEPGFSAKGRGRGIDVVDDAAVVAGGDGVLVQGAVGPEVEVAFQGDGGTGEDGAGFGVADADVDADFGEFVEGDVAELGGLESHVGEAEEDGGVVGVDGVDEPGGWAGGVEDFMTGGLAPFLSRQLARSWGIRSCGMRTWAGSAAAVVLALALVVMACWGTSFSGEPR